MPAYEDAPLSQPTVTLGTLKDTPYGHIKTYLYQVCIESVVARRQCGAPLDRFLGRGRNRPIPR